MPIVWIVMWRSFAISAAFSGGTRLAVSLPSVRSTSTFSRSPTVSVILTATPMASPIAVCGPAMPIRGLGEEQAHARVIERQRRLREGGLAEDDEADAVASSGAR